MKDYCPVCGNAPAIRASGITLPEGGTCNCAECGWEGPEGELLTKVLFRTLRKGMRSIGIRFRITEAAEDMVDPVITGQFSVIYTDGTMNLVFSTREDFEDQIIIRMREKFENEVVPHARKQLKTMERQREHGKRNS